jgi:hydroxymethylglutaryl-CoA lyase
VSTEPDRSDPKPTVNLVEVGPRDGLQSESEVLPPGARAELISRLVDAGARRIEVVSFVNPAVVPQMAEAEAVLDELGPSGAGVSYIGLVLNERGLDRALATSVDEINFVVAAADGYNRSNQGVDAAVTLRAIETMVPRATEDGRSVTLTISVAYGDPYDGEVGLDRVVHIASRAAGTGVREIALGDTIGVAVPTDVAAWFTALQAAVPEVTLRAHFHNTRNAGLANLYAAVASGVDVFDTSVGGIGGSPFAPAAGGNVATEDALFFLSRLGVQTGQDLAAVVAVGEWLGERLVRQLPAALQRVPPWPPDVS